MKSIEIRPGFKIIEEPAYSPGSTDNVRRYQNEVKTGECPRHTTAIGIVKTENGEERFPFILLGCGGGSSLHAESFVLRNDFLYLGIDDSVVAIDAINENILWIAKVDSATCFGLFWDEATESLISWGELEIASLTQNGKIEWAVSGRDIFSGKFSLQNGMAFAEDFEGTKYEVDLKQGLIKTKNE